MSRTSRNNRLLVLALAALLGACDAAPPATTRPQSVDLSPSNWPAGEYERFLAAQDVDRTAAGYAEGKNGMPITTKMAGHLEFRGEDLKRLPETRAVFTKSDGTLYKEGELFRQPALAGTLRAVAKQCADYMYKGRWAQRLVAAVQADGGKMTLEDLARYDVIWADPLIGRIGKYEVHTNPVPNIGGVALIEAQNMAAAARLTHDGHRTESGKALRKAVDIAQLVFLDYVPDAIKAQVFPGMDLSPQARVSSEHAADLWARVASGAKPFEWKSPGPKHSDDVVAIDKDGNIAAITHSINTVLWGKTAIVVDGITIADAAFQQAQIARIKPGNRLPAPTETGILFKDGKAVLGFASMGSGLHQRTFQCLLNYTAFDMSVRDAIDTADFFLPAADPKTFALTVNVPKGRFSKTVLDVMGYAYEEIDTAEVRFGGEGIWVAISRDPVTGLLQTASHNRNNSAALAY